MVREKLLDMLMLHEGLELKPYKCTADKTTIGVGRNLQDVGITEDEAKYLLQNDIDRILKEVEHWSFLEKLNEPRQAVILDMVFNMGVTRFNANTWVKTFAAIKNEEWDEAKNLVEKAISIEAKEESFFILGEILFHFGKVDSACEAYRKGMKMKINKSQSIISP